MPYAINPKGVMVTDTGMRIIVLTNHSSHPGDVVQFARTYDDGTLTPTQMRDAISGVCDKYWVVRNALLTAFPGSGGA